MGNLRGVAWKLWVAFRRVPPKNLNYSKSMSMQDHFISLNHLVSFNFSLVSQLIGVYPSWSSLWLNISIWACYFQRYEFFSISLTWYFMVSGEESPWLYYVNALNFFNLGCMDGTSFGSLNVGAPTEGCLGTPSFYQFSRKSVFLCHHCWFCSSPFGNSLLCFIHKSQKVTSL